MSVEGPRSGVDRVKRMQPGDFFKNVWLMFDHVKHVKYWTSMACHVYGSTCWKVMTIAVCDMQYKVSMFYVECTKPCDGQPRCT